ncbi:MAG: AI-2E family transporter [Deltaproteobacteria bacterium]|nr:MAG: AI-2E family transporter [Deltaproteobacteria bacterium]
MKREHIFLIFALFFTFLCFYLLYQILSPFLTAILWAILLAMVFYPLYDKVRKFMRKKELLSALAMTVLVVLVIILPSSLLMISLANEAVDAYHRLDEMMKTGQLQAYFEEIAERPVLNWIWSSVRQYFTEAGVDPAGFLLKNLKQISTFLFNQTSTVLKGISTFVAGFFFTLLSLYYLFKDGDHLFKKFKEMIPIPSKERNLLIRRFRDMVHATIYGGILIAILQGVLGGLAFWFLGIHSPVLWGTAMAFLSFIPIGGTALIWAPATLLLFLQGDFLRGLILLVVGVFGISMVDNLLRPHFISARTNIHPLLLFFAVLGGIQAFGLIGIVVGPLIATLCITLIEIYIQAGRFAPE